MNHRRFHNRIAIFAFVFVLSIAAPTDAHSQGPIRNVLNICTTFFSGKKPLTEAQYRRRTALLRIFLNFRSPLSRLTPQVRDGVPSHGDTVFRSFNSRPIFYTLDPAPVKSILDLVRWVESQGEDFAWETYDRLLLLIQDSLEELKARGLNSDQLEKVMDEKVGTKFDFYFDQDPSQKKPSYKTPSRLTAEESRVLREKALDRTFSRIVLDEKVRKTRSTVDENSFTVDRDRFLTQRLLGVDVFDFLKSSKIQGDWYDIGSALAKLQREWLKTFGPLKNGKIIAVAPDLPKLEKFKKAASDRSAILDVEGEVEDFYRDLGQYSNSFSYLHGAWIEQRTDLPRSVAMLVTDIMGALSYTSDWRNVILTEAQLLKPGGLLLSHRTGSRVVTADGRSMDWFEFVLEYGTGLKLKKKFSGRLAIVLERTQESLFIPELELLYSSGWGTPPKLVYYCAQCGVD